MEANEVQLMVVANLLITPAEVYVMPGDIVPFKIFYVSKLWLLLLAFIFYN